MLQSLTIENYALINYLEIRFHRGLSIITGETGAGKTIFLDALSLILGQRADINVLKDKSKKCIVEATFLIENKKLCTFFKDHELDFDTLTILRREILPEGKSRAFINDTPVNLNLLKELGANLVDIHSQHENLLLSDNLFQLKVIDTKANHVQLIDQYIKEYLHHKELMQQSCQLLEKSQKAKADLEYLQFQFDQLNEAKLFDEDEQQVLENECQTLTHAEEIKAALINIEAVINDDEKSIHQQIRNIRNLLVQIKSFFPKTDEYLQRFESILIELKDINNEISTLNRSIEYNPGQISQINDRLTIIYNLQQKHHTSSIAQLIEIRVRLEKEIFTITNYETDIDNLKNCITKSLKILSELSDKLTKGRKKVIPSIEQTVSELLVQMGMPHARFTIAHELSEDFLHNGKDKVQFLFSANRNIAQQEISRIASGGEFSRLMLSIKKLLSLGTDMPTIIFDEIDTGVSGEIADKVGNILQEMSKKVQLINVTHLPQIAAKADVHFHVFKTYENQTTTTHIRKLDNSEQVIEIARMLSGNELTDAAILNAKELLRN